MSKQPDKRSNHNGVSFDDSRSAWIRSMGDISGWLFYGSLIFSILSFGYLIYGIIVLGKSTSTYSVQEFARLSESVAFFGKIFLISTIVLVISAIVLWYDQTHIGYIFLGVGVLLWFVVPSVLQIILGVGINPQAAQLRNTAINQLQIALWIYLIPAVGFSLWDIGARIYNQTKGKRNADDLDYTAVADPNNDVKVRFLGKCWQSPYCRSAFRKRCPIYLAKSTCWQERIGCLCDEPAIRMALDGINLPADDTSAAASHIPINNKLPNYMKVERCRTCVIYHERQQQKYSIAAPFVVLVIFALLVRFHDFIFNSFIGGLDSIDKFMIRMSLSTTDLSKGGQSLGEMMRASSFLTECLLFVIILIGIGYVFKGLEYIFFKAQL